MPSVHVNCPVNPSESDEKVEVAIRNIFPDIELERTDQGFIGRTESLEKFKMLIRRNKILDTTRNVLLRNSTGRRTKMHLNKQVAFVGKVTFADESTVLGTIEVTIEDDNIEALIDKVAPTTNEGEEIF